MGNVNESSRRGVCWPIPVIVVCRVNSDSHQQPSHKNRNPVGVNGEKIAKFSYVGGEKRGEVALCLSVIHYQLSVIRGANQGRPYFLALR